MIYQKYHRYLYALALKYLKNPEAAEDAVQHVLSLIHIWLEQHAHGIRYLLEPAGGSENTRSPSFTA